MNAATPPPAAPGGRPDAPPPPPASTAAAFRRGVVDSLPFVLVVGPFGFVFGVLGTEAGLNLAAVMGFSVLVIAGASQLAALQLMLDNAPAVIVLASALAVNLRMAMYSASLAPWIGAAPLWQRALVAYLLVDQSYAVSVANYEREPRWDVAQRIALYFGTVVLIAPVWYGFTLAGALLGRDLPEAWALDFAVPIAFIALIAPGLRTLAHVAAASMAIVLGLAFAGLPYNLGLLLAAGAAMAVAAEVERRGHARPISLGRQAR